MKTCKFGSEKKDGAPATFSTNEIGVLCFVVGAEGILCRLLDLVPEAIKKIVTLNPDLGNADQILKSILKSVAKSLIKIAITDTGEIKTADFCKSPPPETEDINYSDVFRFIAELVPILSQFYAVQDVVFGDVNTKLLEKIVKIWLSKKWYEYCECSRSTEPKPVDSYQNSNFIGACSSEVEQDAFDKIVENANYFNQVCKEGEAESIARLEAASSSVGEAINEIIEGAKRIWGDYFIEAQAGSQAPSDPIPNVRIIRTVNYGTAIGTFILTGGGQYSVGIMPEITIKYINPSTGLEDSYKAGGGYIVAYSAYELKVTFENNCPPPILPSPDKKDIPEPDFCALFPDDPLCTEDDTDEDGNLVCRVEYTTVVEFVGCKKFKKFKRYGLNYGDLEEEAIDVDVYQDCKDKKTNTFVLFNCNALQEAIKGCTDPQATNYNPDAQVDDGSCIYDLDFQCNSEFNNNLDYNEDRAARAIKNGELSMEDAVQQYFTLSLQSQLIESQSKFPDCDFEKIFINRVNKYLNDPNFS